MEEEAVEQVNGQGVLPQSCYHRDPTFEPGRQTHKHEEDHAGGTAHDESPSLPAVAQIFIAVGPQHHFCGDALPQQQPLQAHTAKGRKSQNRPPEGPPRALPALPQALRPSEVVAQQKPGLEGNDPGGTPLVVNSLIKARQQRHAEEPFCAVKSGKHTAEEQKGGHMEGVNQGIEELSVRKFPRDLQQVPQHRQSHEQKADIIILIFPRFHTRSASFLFPHILFWISRFSPSRNKAKRRRTASVRRRSVYAPISAPPHSTAVKPVRSGAVRVWGSTSTGWSSPCQAINTRIRVSGAGSTVSMALSV